MEQSNDRLHQALRRLLGERPATVVDERPRSPFDVQIRQRIDDQARELAEIRTRVNMLFFAIITGVLIDILLRLTR